jgi:hypothetical protein
MALQVIVRQLVTDMLQTELHPVLQQHAAQQSELQATLAPPAPTNGSGASTASAAPPGPGMGMV